jgi:hypothetical protein
MVRGPYAQVSLGGKIFRVSPDTLMMEVRGPLERIDIFDGHLLHLAEDRNFSVQVVASGNKQMMSTSFVFKVIGTTAGNAYHVEDPNRSGGSTDEGNATSISSHGFGMCVLLFVLDVNVLPPPT